MYMHWATTHRSFTIGNAVAIRQAQGQQNAFRCFSVYGKSVDTQVLVKNALFCNVSSKQTTEKRLAITTPTACPTETTKTTKARRSLDTPLCIQDTLPERETLDCAHIVRCLTSTTRSPWLVREEQARPLCSAKQKITEIRKISIKQTNVTSRSAE